MFQKGYGASFSCSVGSLPDVGGQWLLYLNNLGRIFLYKFPYNIPTNGFTSIKNECQISYANEHSFYVAFLMFVIVTEPVNICSAFYVPMNDIASILLHTPFLEVHYDPLQLSYSPHILVLVGQFDHYTDLLLL